MAENDKNIDETSRLLESSEDFRTCSLAKNAALYTKGDEYKEGSSYTIANDGDERGRDPDDKDQNNPNIGTRKDVSMRECTMAKNAALYTCGDEYCRGSQYTISNDGDGRGRDPEDIEDFNNPNIGTKCDVEMRNCLLARNGALYTCGDEYSRGSSYTISNDGDGRGRDPDDKDQNNPNIGTKCDVTCRVWSTARNVYNCGNEYCAGSDNV